MRVRRSGFCLVGASRLAGGRPTGYSMVVRRCSLGEHVPHDLEGFSGRLPAEPAEPDVLEGHVVGMQVGTVRLGAVLRQRALPLERALLGDR